MANILQVSRGAFSQSPTTAWSAPNSLFNTVDRNDGSIYGWDSATSTVTLPASSLADGYLFVWGYEYEDTSGGRHNPQGRMVQASGSGTFASATTSGYNRDASEDRSYVSGWSFVDGPSASSTFQFQWHRDSDSPTGGTVRSFLQVIPLYYADAGIYTSSSTACPGGTTPSQITGFSGTDGTNITLASDTVSVTGDNKRYLCLGGAYWQDIGNARTQRWMGLRVDGSKDDAAKGCAYARNASNADVGVGVGRLIETATATRTIDMFVYRGDGVTAGQGGADAGGNTTGVNPSHAMVVLELNDSAEVFSSTNGSNTQEFALTGPVDVNIADATNIEFNDSASFTRSTDTAVNVEQDMDLLAFANISHARESSITSGARWTVHGEFTVNGTEDTDVGFHGNYNRGNQSSQDTHGSSTNQFGAFAITAGQDFGVSNQELAGTEGGGGDIETQAGWVGFGLLNLDTLEGGVAPVNATATPTGAASTASAGTPTIRTSVVARPVGVEVTASAGEVSSASIVTGVLGAVATAAAGVVTVNIGTSTNDAVAQPQGVEVTASAGDVNATANVVAQPGGVGATAEAQPMTQRSAVVGVGGVEATAEAGIATGDVSATTDANATPSGVEVAASAGEVTVRTTVVTQPLGAEGAALAGNVDALSSVVARPEGVIATSEVGTATIDVTGNVTVTLTGAEATAEAGEAGALASVVVSPSGVEATSGAGDVTTSAGGNVTRVPDGTEIVATAGEVTATASVVVEPTGVEVTANAGTVTATPTSISIEPITPSNGRVAFLGLQNPHTYFELNTTNLGTNYGDDPAPSDNSAVSSGDISTSDSYQGMNNQNDPPGGTLLDTEIITDAAALVYIPAGLTHGNVYGLFSNGSTVNAQIGALRATATGVEIAVSHNASTTNRDVVIHEIPDAALPGWFTVGFQFSSAGGLQGDMALWINGVKWRSGTRNNQLVVGSVDPELGDATGQSPEAPDVIDPPIYTGGTWGPLTAIDATGILIANFTADNATGTNTAPPGNGDDFYTDYHDTHTADGNQAVGPSGVEVTTSAGDVSARANVVAQPDGVQVEAQAQPMTLRRAVVGVEGVEATAEAGDATATTSGAGSVTVTPEGVEVTATAQPMTRRNAVVGVEGVSATAEVGDAQGTAPVGGSVTVSPEGVEVTATAEPMLGSSVAVVDIEGVEVTATAEPLDTSSAAIVDIDGAAATAEAGEVTVSTIDIVSVTVTPDGVEVQALVGGIAVSAGGSVLQPVDGVEVTAEVGEISVSASVIVRPEGVGVTAEAGEVTTDATIESNVVDLPSADLTLTAYNPTIINTSPDIPDDGGSSDDPLELAKRHIRRQLMEDEEFLALLVALTEIDNE